MEWLNSDTLLEIAEMLKAIAHPVRISIIRLLQSEQSLTVTEIHERLNIEQSTASHHLSILKNKGILSVKRVGKNAFYQIKDDKMMVVVNCLQKCNK